MPRSLRSLRSLSRSLPRLRVLIAGGTAAVLLVALAHAAGMGLRPGLWDVHLVKQIMDGHDESAALAASLAQAQQALANLPPEQRARMQALLDRAGVGQGPNGGFRICVSAAMAQRDLPVLDREGHCQPTLVSRTGTRTNFRFDCTTHGTHMVGTGDAVVDGDLITTHTHVRTTGTDGASHTIDNETQMRFVGQDCGTLKPPG